MNRIPIHTKRLLENVARSSYIAAFFDSVLTKVNGPLFRWGAVAANRLKNRGSMFRWVAATVIIYFVSAPSFMALPVFAGGTFMMNVSTARRTASFMLRVATVEISLKNFSDRMELALIVVELFTEQSIYYGSAVPLTSCASIAIS